MSLSLQEKCQISLLGYFSSESSCNGEVHASVSDGTAFTNSTDQGSYFHCCRSSFQSKIERVACGCHRVASLVEHFKLASVQNGPLIRFSYGYLETSNCKSQLAPGLHHLHWHGKIMSQLDLHVVFYEIPKFCGHHYALNSQSLSASLVSLTKKPQWFQDLQQKQPHFDLDTIILAINSANAGKIISEKHLPLKRYTISFKFLWRFATFAWKLVAAFVASLATFLYMIFQSFHLLMSHISYLGVYIIFTNLFCNTWAIVGLRCCQFLYWPIFLQNQGFRSQSCVEYAEKIALQRHSMWACLVVDVFLGNLLGTALWWHAESACHFITNFAGDITNYLLRNGCVWLMGNPAGFKLNTELATVLGMVSLNTVQIWSTLWSSVGSLFVPITKVIAISGFLFGFTASTGLIIDLIALVTRHMFILHWLLSLIYSRQIMALAALWRLFRGKKWNPLRGRLDSYDYTVEQHIVGSLLFTPLLLLLPTTSAFYIFFAIINSVINIVCLGFQLCISAIHSTPYNRVFIWLLMKRRFPSGIWFEIVASQLGTSISLDTGHVGSEVSSSKESEEIRDNSGAKHTILTVLHSNYMNLGELVWSSYADIFSTISRAAISSSAYGVLTGTRQDSIRAKNHFTFEIAMGDCSL
ncbi:OLC1v1036614C1 [Oldenlandia corymbosa var. corymbosa]|uniref:OLC1v1036614C1 n=1 Tax=Oldenlandia corymbosa var. corymbosa TaxID=529605 RepID=A0AAV1CXS5_OLDCO|nr:OLC1v1036614C1 [Oldenlandia corymbosa var. corymbosa]